MSSKFQEYLMERKSSLEDFIPHIYGFLVEGMLTQRIQNLSSEKAKIQINTSEIGKYHKLVIKHHAREFERKDTVEDKAKASLFIVTLSITLILGSLSFINTEKIAFPKFLLIFLIIGVIYLIISAITSIKALHMRPYNDLYIDGTITGKDYNNLELVEMTKKEEIGEIYECIKLNQLLTTIKSNYVEVTFLGIRNALILVASFFILDVVNVLFPNVIIPLSGILLTFILIVFYIIGIFPIFIVTIRTLYDFIKIKINGI